MNAPSLPTAIRAYYDGTGSSDPRSGSRYLTLAGYVAERDVWPAFDMLWLNVLEQWDMEKGVEPCEYFHVREAHHLKGHFTPARGWTRERVRALELQLLNDCLAQMVWYYRSRFAGTSCTVHLDGFREAVAEHPDLPEKYHRPEAICVSVLLELAKSMLVPPDGGYVPDEAQIELFFDQKERFLNAIHNTWQRRRREPRFRNIVTMRSVEMRRTPAIQAADMLAAQAHRAYNRGDVASHFLLRVPALSGVHHVDYDKAAIGRMLDKAMKDEGAD
jgi:hypothetical protein